MPGKSYKGRKTTVTAIAGSRLFHALSDSAPRGETISYKYTNLVLAIILAALATPIVKWLVIHGGTLGISNPNAISFCNILFVGNICSGIVVWFYYGWEAIWRDLRALPAKALWLLGGNILAGTVLAPILLYTALETTMVTNLVLLTRVEAVAYSLVGVYFFSDTISRMNWAGLIFITVGAIALALLQGAGRFMAGDSLGLLAGILYALGSGMGRFSLRSMSIASFIFVRNLVGAIIFFWLAIILYGSNHFAEAFSADLWVVMTVYAGLVVVLGQITWFQAIATLSSGTVSSWSTATPVLGIMFAYLLLNEIPDMSQWTAAVIIVGGLGISQIRPGHATATPSVLEKGLAGA